MPSAKKPAKRTATKVAKVATSKKPATKATPAKADEPAEPPPPVLRFKALAGCKVLASARRDAGFSEIISVTGNRVKLRLTVTFRPKTFHP